MKAHVKKGVQTLLSIQEKSSLLAYYTLFAIVPLLAYLLALTHLLFKDEDLALLFLEHFKAQQEVFSMLLALAQGAYSAASEGLFAAGALALYLFSVLTIFYNLEKILDQILHIQGPRSWYRMAITYPIMLLVLPLLILAASGIELYFAASFLRDTLPASLQKGVYFLITRLTPYVLVSLFFLTCYTFIPSKKPRFKAALIASLIAALIYELFQWGFTYFQIWALQRNPLYGTFAVFPLFLIWIELSWLNLLAGGKVIWYLTQKKVKE